MLQRNLTVIQLLPALNSGGVERSTLEIGHALVKAGHRSIVVSIGGRLVEQLTSTGSEHITLDIATKSFYTLKNIWALKRLFYNIEPNIIHARSRLPGWLTYLALQEMEKARRPHFITSVHGLNSPGFYSAILTRGERVICVSNTVRDYVLQHYDSTLEGKITVITPGIDKEHFLFGYQPSSSWREEFFANFPQLTNAHILTLPGRGTRLKGHHDAVEILAALKRKNINARLLLLGAQEKGREAYIAEIEQLAAKYDVKDWLVITPPRHDVRDVYAISSLILQLSSKPEAFGRTVLEALSVGRPVLGYAHGGVGELLGELYPAGRVPLKNLPALTEHAVELLFGAPPIIPFQSYSLAETQSSTIKLYEEVAA